MAKSINQVTLMGNLTRDPELRQTPNGQSVCSFSLALNRSYKDNSGEWQELTDYVNCIAWGPLGERVSQYLAKGRRCLVVGRLQSSSWDQDGQKRSKIEVVAQDVTFLDGRGGDGGGYDGGNDTTSASSASAASKAPASSKKEDVVIEDIDENAPINLDDIPF